MPYPQGAIVLAPDPFKESGERPFLIISDDRHPFHGQEYIGVVVTTTERDDAIRLDEEDFIEGSLPRQSYLSPWNPVTLKDWMIDKHIATVSTTTVDYAVSELNQYIGTP